MAARGTRGNHRWLRTRSGARHHVGAFVLMALAVATSCSSTGTETTAGTPTSTAAVTTPGTAPASPGTTEPSVTTPTPPSPEALAANLTAADLGAGWANYPEDAPVYGKDGPGGCQQASGLLDDLAADASASSKIIQFEDRMVFVSTSVHVFATPEDADAYATHVLGDEFIECRRVELEDGLPVSDPPFAIASTGTDAGDGTTPYVGSFAYETQRIVDGAPQPAGAASRHAIYVKGSTVIDVFSQFGYSDGDPADLNESTNATINDGIDVVLSRVEG